MRIVTQTLENGKVRATGAKRQRTIPMGDRDTYTHSDAAYLLIEVIGHEIDPAKVSCKVENYSPLVLRWEV